ncbi:MAG: hypothetical protein HGA45_43020 [Chloroflexales bacterium]|nr:hypothetical protein [Chloroflexales bacterium]
MEDHVLVEDDLVVVQAEALVQVDGPAQVAAEHEALARRGVLEERGAVDRANLNLELVAAAASAPDGRASARERGCPHSMRAAPRC